MYDVRQWRPIARAVRDVTLQALVSTQTMTHNRRLVQRLCLLAVLPPLGCAQPTALMQDHPTRAPELDELGRWVGGWTSEFIQPGSDDFPTLHLEQSFEWTLDRRFLRETARGVLGEEPFEVWVYNTWDPRTGKYPFWFFDSFGNYGAGTRTFDIESREWHSKYETFDAGGGLIVGEGRSRMLDVDHCEHHYTESDPGRPGVLTRYHGFSRRVVQYSTE